MIRGIAALTLLLLLAAFLWYTLRLSEEPLDAPAANPPVPPPPASTVLTGGPGHTPMTFVDSQQCRQCHAEIYDEWSTDQHATAYSEPNFQTFTENYTRIECLSCHAPKPMLETGIENDPLLRDAGRISGVDCLTCHVKDGRVHGTLGHTAGCDGLLEPRLKTSQACYHCHHTHNLFKEFLASPQYKEGQTCQDCHMAPVERALAKGSPVRKTRRHFIHGGGHDSEALKKTLTIDLKAEGRKLTVTVTNVGAAHGVPGEINNRQIRLEVSVLVKQKETVQGREVEMENEISAWKREFMAPPRLARDKIPSTQIMPGEPRAIEFELPVDHGRIEAVLLYKLEKTMLLGEAVEMARAELKF